MQPNTDLNQLLINAVTNDDVAAMSKLLLRPSVDVNIPADNTDERPQAESLLHFAVYKNNFDMFKLLLPKANPQIIYSVVRYAIQLRCIKIVRYTLKKATANNPNLYNTLIDKPLHWAMIHQNYMMVAYLLQTNTVNVNAQDCFGYTALHWADTWKMALWLIKYGADINSIGPNQYTLLDWAIRYNHTELVLNILKIPTLDNNSDSVKNILHTAVRYSSHNVFAFFLTIPGIDVNAVDSNGNTLLHMLAKHNCIENITLLLQNYQRDVDSTNLNGETALHLAAYHENVEVVERLLKIPGIDINAIDQEGWTPLNAAELYSSSQIINAKKSNCIQIIKLLLWHGATRPTNPSPLVQQCIAEMAQYTGFSKGYLLFSDPNSNFNILPHEIRCKILAMNAHLSRREEVELAAAAEPGSFQALLNGRNSRELKRPRSPQKNIEYEKAPKQPRREDPI